MTMAGMLSLNACGTFVRLLLDESAPKLFLRKLASLAWVGVRGGKHGQTQNRGQDGCADSRHSLEPVDMSAPTVTMADTTGARAQATGGSLDAIVEAFKIVRQFVGERRCANCTLYQESSTNDDTHLPVCDERVTKALESAGLSHYTSVFAREEIDYEVMTDIHEQDMDRMGITRIGARNKLRRLIDAIRAGRYQDDPRPRILPVDVSKDPASDGFAWDGLESPCEPEPPLKSEPPTEETLQTHAVGDTPEASPRLDFYGTKEDSPEDRRRHKRSRSRSLSRSRDRSAARSPDHRRQDSPKRRRRNRGRSPSKNSNRSRPTPRELYASSVITNSLSIRFESPEAIDACAGAFPLLAIPRVSFYVPCNSYLPFPCLFLVCVLFTSKGEIATRGHPYPAIAPNLALEDATRAVFMTYGTILSVRAFLLPNRLFVNFARIEDAQRAMETLTGHTDGGHMASLFNRSVLMVYDYHKMTKHKSFTGCYACTNLP